MLQRVTTPLFYVNNKPHIGHLYSVLYADAIHVWLQNRDQRSTDEHGQKVFQSAILSNLTPIEYCNRISSSFQQMNDSFYIKPDLFVRTTDKQHINFVQQAWTQLLNQNKVYEGKYSGWYCQNDENFVPEKELKDGLSNTGYPVDWVEEKNYFLRIEPGLKQVTDLVQTKGGKFKKEILNELKFFKDICMTRPKNRVNWGIDIPDDPNQLIYVWIDALLGYLNFSSDTNNIQFHHVVGKDIVKFHQIHLPFIMNSLDLKYDANYYVHHHWTVENRKMSKSLNNVVCPHNLLKKFSHSSIRLLFLSQGPQNFDVQFDEGDIIKVFNDYISSFHNSIYRVLSKKIFTQTEFEVQINLQELETFAEQIEKVEQFLNKFDFFAGYQEIRKAFFIMNKYIDQQAPWKIVNEQEKKRVLATIIYMIRRLMDLLKPYIPNEIEQLKIFVGGSLKLCSENQLVKVNNDNLDFLHKKKY